MNIRSIPTMYRGVQMRSKLEATWAKRFDEHGLRWTYESQGFDLEGVSYLPDFWLPDIRTIVEVKGILDEKSETKIARLSEAVGSGGHDSILVVVAYADRMDFCIGEFIDFPTDLTRCDVCRRFSFFLNLPEERCRWCAERSLRFRQSFREYILASIEDAKRNLLSRFNAGAIDIETYETTLQRLCHDETAAHNLQSIADDSPVWGLR